METLRMSRKERQRLELMGRVKRGELELSKAAELLRMSYRQAKRVYRRYQDCGDAGLVHRLRGRSSNRRTGSDRREQVLSLFREKYVDFGPTLAAEYLAAEVGLRPAADHPWRGVRAAPPATAASAGPPCSASVASVAALPAQPSLRRAGQPKRELVLP